MGEYLQNQYLERDYAIELAKKHGLFNEIDRLKEQLKEANEIIQTLHKRKECDAFDHLIFGDYLEKWGVK